MDHSHSSRHGSLVSYIIGFVISIVLTLAAYFIVQQHVSSLHETFSHSFITFAVVGFALLQLLVQLIFFLHLGRDAKPHWNLIVFVYAFLLLLIIVVGSLWVMHHLNYNMMLMPPAEVDAYMLDK
ncbi:cytochrome o ubiquinol oxidase subunit IV [Candidatus Kaiserbacteria bacterium]|nr:cytochrome o ubiquinol oxidase subunit IV [Candidatus Kaiserbacteria bacterium]